MKVMDETAQIQEKFKAALANLHSRQAIKAFLLRQATIFLGQTETGSKTRQERRIAAKLMARRLTKKILKGEELIDAGV